MVKYELYLLVSMEEVVDFSSETRLLVTNGTFGYITLVGKIAANPLSILLESLRDLVLERTRRVHLIVIFLVDLWQQDADLYLSSSFHRRLEGTTLRKIQFRRALLPEGLCISKEGLKLQHFSLDVIQLALQLEDLHVQRQLRYILHAQHN